jgi:hypothetical protein
MASDLYESIKAEIALRAKDRTAECRDLDDPNKVLRSQGAARELEQLLDVMERLEHPVEPQKEVED